MDRAALITRLWSTGHFWPDNPDVSLDEACKCEMDHPMVEAAMESARAADANYDLFRAAHHGRWHALDASFGPATEQLLQLSRCPVPDHVPPPDAALDGAEPWLLEIIESMRATGSGSWPVPGCAPPNKADEHSIRINVDTSNMTSGWRRDWDEIVRKNVAGWAEMGLRVIYVMDGDPKQSEISKRFERLPGYIGWNQFPTPGTCSQTISGRLGTNYDSGRLKPVLEFHETGHGVRLQHTRGGVMNPSILSVPVSWKGDPHERTVRAFFGGEPIRDDKPPPPPPPPTSDAPLVDLSVTIGSRIYEMYGALKSIKEKS